MSNKLKQLNDNVFLTDLFSRLSGADLSRLDLRTSGDFHHRHNLLIENYEIDIVLCIGRWVFEPDIYERYEICVSENASNKRTEDCPMPELNNNIMLAGTMATNLGIYPAKQRFINQNSDCFEYLCLMRNPQLFGPAQRLYRLFDKEYIRRRRDVRTYEVPELKTLEDRRLAQMRLLASLQRTL